MASLTERFLPARLGSAFRWLVASSWAANFGDGFALAAGPLLVASQSHNASLVALALLLQRLPWLLFGLFSGAVADRINRVVLSAAVELARAGVLTVLAAAIFAGWVNIAVVLGALFLLGTAEVFSDTASNSLPPSLVDTDDLPLANARIFTGVATLNQLAGPPIGAALFAVGMAWPFVGQAVLVGLGAVLITRVRLPERQPAPAPAPALAQTHLRAEVLDGIRWTAHHPAVRTLALTIFFFNITFGAAWSVLVLYAEERLHMGAVGFGVLTTASAVGGLAGILGYGWLTRRVSLGNIMRVGLIIETFTHLSLALTTVPAVAVGIMVVFGAHAFVWGTTSNAVRQRAVPLELQGRVSSVNSLGVYGGLVIGAALGGALASHFGVTAPFWFAFGGSGVFVVFMWRQLAYIAHDRGSAVGDHGAASPDPA
jgi:predicted MFS family arabinose efflux permease